MNWTNVMKSKFFCLKLCFSVLVLSWFQLACVSSHIKVTAVTTKQVKAVALTAIQFNRPDYEPADQDDFTHQARNLNCVPPEQLWSEFLEPSHAKLIMNCLNSLESGVGRYLYIPKTQPYLELNADVIKRQPECLLKTLKTIPLPREIYFLGKEAGTEPESELECYSASFSTKTNRVLDAELRYARINVNFEFPLSRKLMNEKDLQIWLETKLLGILNQNENDFMIRASLVPDLTCTQCFKNDALFLDKKKHKLNSVEWP